MAGGWVAGLNGNKTNSASVEVEVEVEAELGKKSNRSATHKSLSEWLGGEGWGRNRKANPPPKKEEIDNPTHRRVK